MLLSKSRVSWRLLAGADAIAAVVIAIAHGGAFLSLQTPRQCHNIFFRPTPVNLTNAKSSNIASSYSMLPAAAETRTPSNASFTSTSNVTMQVTMLNSDQEGASHS